MAAARLASAATITRVDRCSKDLSTPPTAQWRNNASQIAHDDIRRAACIPDTSAAKITGPPRNFIDRAVDSRACDLPGERPPHGTSHLRCHAMQDRNTTKRSADQFPSCLRRPFRTDARRHRPQWTVVRPRIRFGKRGGNSATLPRHQLLTFRNRHTDHCRTRKRFRPPTFHPQAGRAVQPPHD